MLKKTILLCLLAIATTGLAQKTKNNGYYGKRFFISGFSASQIPVFHLLDDTYYGTNYVYKNGVLTKKDDLFNIGARLGIGFSYKRNRSIIFQYGYDQFHIASPYSYSYYGDNQTNYLKSDGSQVKVNVYQHEQIAVSSNYYMLKMEFAPAASLLPMGLSHQVGIGINRLKALSKDYHFVASYNVVGQSNSTVDTQMYSESNSPFVNRIKDTDNFPVLSRLVLQYAINIRTPLSKSLFLSYGFEYNFSFKLGQRIVYNYYDSTTIQDQAIYSQASDRFQAFSFIKFNFGLAFAF